MDHFTTCEQSSKQDRKHTMHVVDHNNQRTEDDGVIMSVSEQLHTYPSPEPTLTQLVINKGCTFLNKLWCCIGGRVSIPYTGTCKLLRQIELLAISS